LLRWLTEQRIPTAVATASSASTAQWHLARARLTGCFAAVLTRDDVTRRKPHPELFLRAAAALGANPAACLVVEDSAPGIEAACAAGMIPVLVPDLAPIPPSIRMKSFAELPDLHRLRALLAGS
jgi:HAD superfamily hydrolase (TIGR01509 family)